MSLAAEGLLPAIALFAVGLLLASASLWLADRVAPVFFRGVVAAPNLASYFLDPKAEMSGGWDRSAVGLLAFVFCVIASCGLYLVARLMGFVS